MTILDFNLKHVLVGLSLIAISSFNLFSQGDDCTNAIDLCGETSPYSGTTTGMTNNFTIDGGSSSEDMIFYVDIPDGISITIGQTSNSYDSEHELRYGATDGSDCPGSNFIISDDDPDIQNHTWTNSTGSTKRFYWLQGGWSTNDGAFTLAWSFSSDPCAPPTCNDPSTLAASNITPESADLSWTENGSATTWDIELGTTGFSPTGTPTVNDLTSNPYTHTGLSPSTSYDFYVRADCGALQSNWVGPFSFSTTACNVQNPSALTATNVFSISADLGWTENGNATTWDIELGAAGFTPTGTPTANNVGSNPYTYSGLTPTTSYDYYVRSECGGSTSSWIGPYNFTTSSFPTNYTSELVSGWARSVVQDPSGNYLWVGYATNSGSDFQVVKTTQGGNIIWTKTIGESGTDMAFDVVNAGDGGFVIVGHTNSASLIASGSYDIMVTKINTNGGHEWTRVIGTTSSEYSSQCSIIRNPDGTYAVAAVTNSDMFFVHLSSVGAVLADKTLNTQSAWAYSVTKATGTNDGWVVAGKYQGPLGSEYMVTKIKEDATYDWSMVWGDGSGTGEVLYAVIENAADDYTVFGYTYAEGTSPKNMYAARFTNSGSGPTVSWIKTYGNATGCGINDAILASDGNYVVTGQCFGGSYTDTYLVKINASTGAIMWQTERPDDTNGNRQGDGVFIDNAGSYLVAGLGGFDMLKFAPDGTICEGLAGTLSTDDLGTTLPNYDATEGQSTNTFGTSNSSVTPTISDFGTLLEGCNIVLLPVQLSRFNVVCNSDGVLCSWTTASELDNAYFTLQRSDDGFNFVDIATIPGAGNSTTELNYRFIDDHYPTSSVYYRLKQTDYNDDYSYSDVKAIKCPIKDGMHIYPNPFGDIVNVKFDEMLSTDCFISVENMLGQIVYSDHVKAGTKTVQFNLGELLEKGAYYIKASNQEQVVLFIEKVVHF